MDPARRRQLIDQYKDAHRIVTEALAGATDAELDAKPAPGKWSARQIVHHLGDSEMSGAVRLRLLVTGPNATILAYDQDAFAARLYYDRPIAASLDAFKAARASTVEILERLSEADWQREGTHSEHGRLTVERWLEIYAAHGHKHAEQIRVARASARPAQ
jgi:hypothetical protein